MTLVAVPYEGTNGTALTLGNTGVNSISAFGAATAVFDTAAAFDGSTGATFTSDGSNSAFAQKNFAAAATTGAVSLAFQIPASTPAADYGFATIYDTSAARVLGFVYRSNGEIAVSDKPATYIRLLTAAQAAANTKLRFELVVTNLSATAGSYTARAYNAANTQVGSSIVSTTSNLGTTAMNYLRHGATTANAFTARIDSVQLDDGRTTEIGRLVSTGPPVVIGAVTENMAVIDATGSTGNGPFTYAISPTTGVVTIASGIWSVPSGATYTVTVTDAAAQSASSPFLIAPGTSGVVVKTQIRVAGAFTTF